jgi:ABC-type antimicrobial peptide transport system permease subunit
MGHEHVRDISTMDDFIARTLVQDRMIATLSSFFAGLAVALASVGLYGLLSYSIARRTREIGVRIAVGASRSAIVRMIVREGVILTMAGVIVGVPCALAAGRLTRALLFDLSPSQPVALSVGAVFLIVVGFVAGLVPAWRAARLNPITALRCD